MAALGRLRPSSVHQQESFSVNSGRLRKSSMPTSLAFISRCAAGNSPVKDKHWLPAPTSP